MERSSRWCKWGGGGGTACTIWGFNVSNLTGIKRRMIDIDKKVVYFLLNVWKCTVFSHLHLKFAKIAIFHDPKFFFRNKYKYRYQKTEEFYADFKFVDADLNECPLKVVFLHFFVVFCLLGAFFKSGINEFEISIKFCVFLYPYWYFSRKNVQKRYKI